MGATRCPKCGQDPVETVTTGAIVERVCPVCAYSWRVSEWAKATDREQNAVARQAMTR